MSYEYTFISVLYKHIPAVFINLSLLLGFPDTEKDSFTVNLGYFSPYSVLISGKAFRTCAGFCPLAAIPPDTVLTLSLSFSVMLLS